MTDLTSVTVPPPPPAPAPAPGGVEPGPVPASWGAELERLLRTTWAGLVAGLIAGLAFGGIGGRIAMRIVTLQSDSHLDGVLTDDGARVDDITFEGTALLAMFTTFVGVLGALGYLVVRRALPRSTRVRAAAFAAVCGVVGGSQVVQADGVDFTLLGHRWVSVALFVGLLAGYGAVVALLAERLLAADGLAWRVGRPALAPPFLALTPGLAFIPVAAVIVGVAAARRRGLARLVPPVVAVWAVRAVLVTATVLAAAALTSTLAELAELG